MQRRSRWTRVDLRIPRELIAGILVVAGVFAWGSSAMETAARWEGAPTLTVATSTPAPISFGQAVNRVTAAYWPSRGDSASGVVGGALISAGADAAKDSPSETAAIPIHQVTVYVESMKKAVVMDLEEYIYGVVAAEVPASYQPEAIRAQAVAARTYAVYEIEKGGCNKGADVCTASNHCQAYASEETLKQRWGGDYAMYSEKIRDAVESTRSEIVTYQGEPIHALFHAISGGWTEDALAVFNMNLPYLKSVESKNEEDAPRYKQTFTFTRKALAQDINKAYPKANVTADRLQGQIEIKERLASGQISKIRLGNVTITGRDFRKITGIASANFTIGYTDDNVVVYTTGFGHGVGMSQAGANAMAKNGAGYREILLHYYTATEIQLYGA